MKTVIIICWLFVCGICAFVLLSLMTFKSAKMYNLAFRVKSSPDACFWLDKDYCFEEYSVDLAGRWWLADPFLFSHGGKDYVFYEAFDLWTGKGKLGCSIIDTANKRLSPPRIILDRKYHFSWPYIFEKNGQIYIMPETCEDYRVRLFRAVNFPDEWTEEEVLVNDIYGVDSIMMQKDGRDYLLVSEQYHNTPTGSFPSCYVKNRLFTFKPDGSFSLEPRGSIDPAGKTVSIGDKGIRNAGMMISAQGMYIRPGQDCRDKQYGRGVVFFRVDSVEPYAEEEIFSIDCENIGPHLRQSFVGKVIGLHTYNSTDRLEVIDFAGHRSTTLKTRIASKLALFVKLSMKVLSKFSHSR